MRCNRCCVCASRGTPRKRFGNFSATHQRRHMRFAGMAVADPDELKPPVRAFQYEEEPAVAALLAEAPRTVVAEQFGSQGPARVPFFARLIRAARQIAAGLFGWILLPNGRAS